MGIYGTIPTTISELDALTDIHLDNNSLTGQIPDSLSYLDHLTVLLLNDNNLSGEVPPELLEKSGLLFNYSDNRLIGQLSPTSPPPGSPTKKKPVSVGVLIGAIAGGVLALGFVIWLLWYFCSKKPAVEPNHPDEKPTALAARLRTEAGYVTYENVQVATDNFKEKIGRGSYGWVYHGWLNNREVAVKVNSVQSNQGHDEFVTEVDILTRVHHKNLVSLIGYCDDENQLVLIYEYQVNGTLREWLYDPEMKPLRGTLDWEMRLQIAADAAKGLEYLHKGCNPTIIHRDVKSSNILLDDHRRAKVADFGISKSIPYENTTGYSTCVKGTPGYLDPEYHLLGRLTHKSDVYSFGVVLAELVTGRSPFSILQDGQNFILMEWLKKLVTRNDMQAFADPNLQGNFDPESMWRVVEIALSCVDPLPVERPDITQVVQGIAEAAALQKRMNSTAYNPLGVRRSRSFTMRSSICQPCQTLK